MRDITETRAIKLVDLPAVKRLSENGVVLDCELCFTQNGGSAYPGAVIMLLLPYRGTHTLIARAHRQQVVGQFRLKPDGHCAHIAYLAPVPTDECPDDTLWLHILDAMAVEAGKRGAHLLAAEVDEDLLLFNTMRAANYSIYARQEIWQYLPGAVPLPAEPVTLAEATDADLPEIQLLYCSVVPRLVQQIPDLPGDGHGLVYRRGDRIEGYIAVAEGKSGVYLMPHLHPDVFSQAPAILAAAVARVSRGDRLVFVRVRRYQDWLDDTLVALGFELRARQAVMVKHITAGVRATAFAPLHHHLEAVPSPIKPPTSGIANSSETLHV